MTLGPNEAAETVERDGTTYHFCRRDCRDTFAEDPARFSFRS